MNRNKCKAYYIKEFRPERWHICNSKTNIPVYDNEPYGKDKPLVFKDEDSAIEFRDRINHPISVTDESPADIRAWTRNGML